MSVSGALPRRRRHEKGRDELARSVAGQAQAAARQAASLQSEREALGVGRLRACPLGPQGLKEQGQRTPPQLGRRVEAVAPLGGGARGQEETRRRASLGAVDVGFGGGEAAARSRHAPVLLRRFVHRYAERTQPGGEGARVSCRQRAAKGSGAARECRQEQRSVGDALRARHTDGHVQPWGGRAYQARGG